jgi:hypothetical protein
MLPVREVAFDTRDQEREYNTGALGRVDPRTFMDDTDFQITYSFSTAIRSNTRGVVTDGAYGSGYISFRRLYDLLCTVYNSGERFIDTYFQKNFPSSPAGRDFMEFENMVRDGIHREWYTRYTEAWENRHTKAGALYKRRARLLLKDFSVWKSQYVRHMLRKFDRNIRAEIIAMLSTGRISLSYDNKQRTKELRRALGLPAVPKFYVTGQLIRALEIDIRIPEAAFA